MEKKIKSLEIVFENTDSIEIPAKAVLGVSVQGITQGLNIYQDMLEGSYTAKDILLRLDVASLEKIYDTFEDADGFSRLSESQDIVCLVFHTDDGHETEIYADWCDDDADQYQYNCYQTSKKIQYMFDDFYSLFIAIGKDIKIPGWMGDNDE